MHDFTTNTKKNVFSWISLIALVFLLIFSVNFLSGCNGSNNEEASKSSSAAENTTESETLKIDTDNYSIELPKAWASFADVEYDSEENAQVVCKNNSSIALLTCSLSSSDDEITGGDIGNGMVYSTDLSDGKRLDVWAPNYLYLFWADATGVQGSESYASISDEDKQTIIELTSGQDIKIKKLTKVKSEEKLINKYGTPYEYLGNLISDNVTIK